MLANASLRISLRVNNRADSIAVIGTDDAASGHAIRPGQAWLARAGGEVTALQVALAVADDIETVARRWGSDWQPRRPWLDPLPSVLPAEGHPGAMGVVDLPAEQAQRPVCWHPQEDGNLLVVGGARSGKSTLLSLLDARLGGSLVAPGIEALWDALQHPSPVMLLDDVDLLVAQYSPDHQQAVLDLLASVLRSPGSRVALTAQRLSSPLQQLAALCDSRILLRMPSRQEHVLAGGSSADFDAELGPGAGYWRGVRVQLLLTESTTVQPPAIPPVPRAALLAVSSRPRVLAGLLRSAGHQVDALAGAGDPVSTGVVVTDPDGWQANWARCLALAQQRPVLFHECSVAEFRQLSRQRRLPPPLADPATTAWLLEPGGDARRVRL